MIPLIAKIIMEKSTEKKFLPISQFYLITRSLIMLKYYITDGSNN